MHYFHSLLTPRPISASWHIRQTCPQRPGLRAWAYVSWGRREDLTTSYVSFPYRDAVAIHLHLPHYLAQYISPRPGLIKELETDRVVGRHEGVWHYTIGQNARIPGLAQKAFVARKDLQQNTIYVVGGP